MSLRRRGSTRRGRPERSDESDGELDREQSMSWAHTQTEEEPHGLFRSLSGRRRERRERSASVTHDDEEEPGLRRTWSLKSLRLSFKRSKSSGDGVSMESPSTPSSTARAQARSGGQQQWPGSPGSVDSSPEKPSKGGFKAKLRNTLHRKKGPKSRSSDPSMSPRSDSNPGSGPAVRSSFFKSKKGQHWWASRFGTDEVVLSSVPFSELLDSEREAFTNYAIEQLSITLRQPVVIPADGDESIDATASVKKKSSRGLFKKFGSTKSGPASPYAPPASPAAGNGSPRPPSSESMGGQVFGVPLEVLLEEDRIRTGDATLKIPIIAKTTIDFLEKEGLAVNGIFRVSGSARRVRQINEAFDSGVEPDLVGAAPNDVASVLKFFLRNLPTPLLTTYLYPHFIAVLDLQVEEQLTALRMLCGLLPEASRDLLEAILVLLHKIAEHADGPEGNLMNSRNLALVLGPNLLKKEPTLPTRSSFRRSTSSSSRSLEQRQSGLGDDTPEANMVSAEGDACDVIELLIDYAEHTFILTPDLRDSILLHHQLVDPTMVTQVLKDLIDQKQKRLEDSRQAAAAAALAAAVDIPSTGIPSPKLKPRPPPTRDLGPAASPLGAGGSSAAEPDLSSPPQLHLPPAPSTAPGPEAASPSRILGSRSPSPPTAEGQVWTPSPPPKTEIKRSLHSPTTPPPPATAAPPSVTSVAALPSYLDQQRRAKARTAAPPAPAAARAGPGSATAAFSPSSPSTTSSPSYLEAMARTLLIDKVDSGSGLLTRTDSELAAEMEQMWDSRIAAASSAGSSPTKLSQAASPALGRRGEAPVSVHAQFAPGEVGSAVYDEYRGTHVVILDPELDEEGTYA